VNDIVIHFIETVATTGISAGLGFLATTWRSNHFLKKGVEALLRQQLISIHRCTVAKGLPVPYDLKQQADSLYEAYHGLGGNGVGTQLHDEIMDAHVERENHETPSQR
jgi:hypothetical protein